MYKLYKINEKNTGPFAFYIWMLIIEVPSYYHIFLFDAQGDIEDSSSSAQELDNEIYGLGWWDLYNIYDTIREAKEVINANPT